MPRQTSGGPAKAAASTTKRKTFGEALAAVTAAIPSLEKLDRNKHGNYDYVAVDDFYAEVRRHVAAQGLCIVQNSMGSDVFEAPTGKGGKMEAWLKIDFTYAIVYEDEVHHVGGMPGVARMSMGSQAAGTCASYSMKNFLRSTFLVVTGEYDLDSGEHEEEIFDAKRDAVDSEYGKKDQSPFEKETSKRSRREEGDDDAGGDQEIGEEAGTDFVDRFSKKLNACETVREVEQLYKKNRSSIDKLSKGLKEAIIGACKVVKEELSDGENLDDQERD